MRHRLAAVSLVILTIVFAAGLFANELARYGYAGEGCGSSCTATSSCYGGSTAVEAAGGAVHPLWIDTSDLRGRRQEVFAATLP
jgi:hypothetical protein